MPCLWYFILAPCICESDVLFECIDVFLYILDKSEFIVFSYFDGCKNVELEARKAQLESWMIEYEIEKPIVNGVSFIYIHINLQQLGGDIQVFVYRL